ncbi:hypothetical protein AK812_SmicGene18770 [Symbiodinium microadriaticum]|uniref:Uncharacterized protein n=1 Tax=Symbiodinium microadriaticum TaxID=2951 RepID=A0A1Q9DU84_SYMMI|nr:hypothetical protein AK812_SmicGene18770 [Symbiodinium microadriaticum]
MDEEWTHAEAEREQVSLRAQVTLLKQSQAAAQAEISKLRRELAQRSSSIVPQIFNFASRQRPESYYVGDAKDPDTERSAYSDQSSVSSDGRRDDSPRGCAADVRSSFIIEDAALDQHPSHSHHTQRRHYQQEHLRCSLRHAPIVINITFSSCLSSPRVPPQWLRLKPGG